MLRAVLAALLAVAACSRADDPGAADLALWRIVAQGCNGAPAAANSGTTAPPPDLECDGAHGAALLKDRCGANHYLLIPTAVRRGVESAELQDPAEPNYFALAWERRARAQAGAPGDASAAPVALAVNSRFGRSQRQLHIHIDRLRPEVAQALRALPQALPADTSVTLQGHAYRVAAQTTLTPSPFAVAARQWQATTEDERARLTIAVVAQAAGAPATGFLVLSSRATLWPPDRGHAEELLVDHRCP